MKGNILDLVLMTTNNVCDLVVDTSNYSITSDHYFKIEFSMLMNNTRQFIELTHKPCTLYV